MIRRLAAAVAVALLLGACGGGHAVQVHSSCDDHPSVTEAVPEGSTAVCDPTWVPPVDVRHPDRDSTPANPEAWNLPPIK